MKDIFEENKITPIKGLLQRYKDRVLIKLTLDCPVKCDFCYRKWQKDIDNFKLSFDDIDRMVELVSKDKQIREVIFSGGEPLMELELLDYAMNRFSKLKQIKIFRIHTRAPVTKPKLISKRFLEILSKKYQQVIYLSVHINNISELTEETVVVIRQLRQKVILYSQSVFLRGINDSVDDLEKLFLGLLELGVRPYNIYHCNNVEGNDKYVIPVAREIKLMTELRKRISGLACPNLIIDIPGNANKIPAPTLFWEIGLKEVKDFCGHCLGIHQLE